MIVRGKYSAFSHSTPRTWSNTAFVSARLGLSSKRPARGQPDYSPARRSGAWANDMAASRKRETTLRAARRVTSWLAGKIQRRRGRLPRTAPAEPTRRAIPRAKHFRDAAVALDSILVRPLDVELSGEPPRVLRALGAEEEPLIIHGCYSSFEEKRRRPCERRPWPVYSAACSGSSGDVSLSTTCGTRSGPSSTTMLLTSSSESVSARR